MNRISIPARSPARVMTSPMDSGCSPAEGLSGSYRVGRRGSGLETAYMAVMITSLGGEEVSLISESVRGDDATDRSPTCPWGLAARAARCCSPVS